MYICFEGIDGSGKSTLARSIYDIYTQRGTPAILTKEPGGTHVGRDIRALVQHSSEPITPRAEFLLYAADRAQHYAQIVAPALSQGITVLSDRSFVSSIAYQGYGRGLDVARITEINRWALQECLPNVFVYIAIDPALAHERIAVRGEVLTRFEKEQRSFFERVITGYEEIFAHYTSVIRLDGRNTPQMLVNECLEKLAVYEK